MMGEEKKCYVKEQGVLGDKTILSIDLASKDYSAFSEAARLMAKHEDDFDAEHDFQDVAVSAFKRLMTPYCNQIGIGVPEETYVWANPLKASMNFSGKKIISGREDVLDGYKPCIDFELKGTKKFGVKFLASGYLEGEGLAYELGVLEDLVKRKYSGGNGIESPRLGEDEEKGRIYVNSIRFIPQVLETFEHFYKKIGKSGLEEIAELQIAIEALEENGAAARILKDEYEKRLGILQS